MSQRESHGQDRPYEMRLPGFVGDEGIGLGDAIKHMTHALGIRACGGCERRAAALNRWLAFTGPARPAGPRR